MLSFVLAARRNMVMWRWHSRSRGSRVVCSRRRLYRSLQFFLELSLLIIVKRFTSIFIVACFSPNIISSSLRFF